MIRTSSLLSSQAKVLDPLLFSTISRGIGVDRRPLASEDAGPIKRTSCAAIFTLETDLIIN